MSTTHITYFIEYKRPDSKRWLRHRTWSNLDEIYSSLEEAEKVASYYTNLGSKTQVYKQTTTITKVKSNENTKV